MVAISAAASHGRFAETLVWREGFLGLRGEEFVRQTSLPFLSFFETFTLMSKMKTSILQLRVRFPMLRKSFIPSAQLDSSNVRREA